MCDFLKRLLCLRTVDISSLSRSFTICCISGVSGISQLFGLEHCAIESVQTLNQHHFLFDADLYITHSFFSSPFSPLLTSSLLPNIHPMAASKADPASAKSFKETPESGGTWLARFLLIFVSKLECFSTRLRDPTVPAGHSLDKTADKSHHHTGADKQHAHKETTMHPQPAEHPLHGGGPRCCCFHVRLCVM